MFVIDIFILLIRYLVKFVKTVRKPGRGACSLNEVEVAMFINTNCLLLFALVCYKS